MQLEYAYAVGVCLCSWSTFVPLENVYAVGIYAVGVRLCHWSTFVPLEFELSGYAYAVGIRLCHWIIEVRLQSFTEFLYADVLRCTYIHT